MKKTPDDPAIKSVGAPDTFHSDTFQLDTQRHQTPPLRLIILLGALSAFSPLAIDMYLPAFPQIEQDLQGAPGAIEFTLSLFLAGLATGQFIIGPLSDRCGRRQPILAGCVLFGVAALLCTVTRSMPELMAARFLMGFAGAAGMVVSRAIVRDLFDESISASVYSFMMMVTGVAPVVAPVLGGQLIQRGHWHQVFYVLSVIGFGCALAVGVTLTESLPPERRSRDSVSKMWVRSLSILVDLRFLPCALAVGFSAGALFAYIAGSPTVFMRLFQVSPRTFSLIFAGNAIGLFCAAQVNRRLVPRLGPHKILRAAAAGSAIVGTLLLVAAATGTGGPALFSGLLFGCIFSLGLIFPNATASAMAPFRNSAGAASAVLGLLQYAVGACGGAAVGLMQTGTAVPMAATIAACQIATGGIILMSVRPRSASQRSD